MSTTLSKAALTDLITAAIRAMSNSYSPYSKFKVGAALLAKSGKIYGGTNIENASSGLTNCAERTALFSAVVAGEREFKALVVVFDDKSFGPLSTPCGACRQVLAEFCAPDMPIYTVGVTAGKANHIMQKRLKDYIPVPFTMEIKPKKAPKK